MGETYRGGAGNATRTNTDFHGLSRTPESSGSRQVRVGSLGGTFSFQVRGTSGALTHDSPFSLTVQALCAPKGASCTANGQCCSNKCTGKSGAKTCK